MNKSAPSSSSVPARCTRCGEVIGRMVQIHGQVQLAAEGWLITDGTRQCSGCGQLFHFRPPKATFEEVARRYQKRVLREPAIP